MEDEWRRLARTVPGTLQVIAFFPEEESVRLIQLAKSKLAARANLVRTIRQDPGGMDIAVRDFVDPDPVGRLPTEILDRALLNIKHRRAHHGKALRVLALCIRHLGLQPGARIWNWQGHYVTAAGNAGDALTMLRSAASSARAAEDAIGIAGTFPESSPARAFWMTATQQLERSATNDATMAVYYVLRMRLYVRLQFFDAWVILLQ